MSWKSPDRWNRLIDGSACAMCAEASLPENDFSFLVAELEQSYLRLPRNQYARGWVIVILKSHACELHDLASDILAGYWRDVAAVSGALMQVFSPVKINYMIFGNIVPHVHCHLLPRFVDHDPSPQLFLDIEKHPTMLQRQEYDGIIADLRNALSSPRYRG